MDVSVLILTYNESIHIDRCLNHALVLSNDIHVVDSLSTDATTDIVCSYAPSGVKLYQNKFIGYSQQINWALSNCHFKNNWVLRLDADEIIDESNAIKLLNLIPDDQVFGYKINRQFVFMGRKLKYGGYSNNYILRLFRYDHANCLSRLVDEHIVVSGKAAVSNVTIVDHNLNDLNWWHAKHLKYADLEAEQRNIIDLDIISSTANQKQSLYLKLPSLIRPVVFFIYRYFIKFGFFDGKPGFYFIFFQVLWYRTLVEAKVYIKNSSS